MYSKVMSKYAWATDIHLDHIDDEGRLVRFAESLVASDPTGVLITGDISNSKTLVYHLSLLERVVQRPVYFVLGNHDYWDGEIEPVRKSMQELTNMSQFLKYMPMSPYVVLTPGTALVGHDCWYDAQCGDPLNSRFMMNDWSMTKDFIQHSGGYSFMSRFHEIRDRASLISQVQKLAHEGVMHIHNGIKLAARHHKSIVVMAHYPPFQESHVYNGDVGDDQAQPWYTCKMLGDMLLDAARAYPDVKFTVLAGHTHGFYRGNHAPNLEVNVGGAAYGRPNVARLIEVP